MNWMRFVAIVVGAGVVTSLTDWFFAGDWLHRRYTYPEIWRQGTEGRAIAVTSPLPFLTCGVFGYITAWLGLHSVSGAVKLAVAVWLVGPLPLILTNAAFMKLHRVFVVSYAIGWLIKLTIVAAAVGGSLVDADRRIIVTVYVAGSMGRGRQVSVGHAEWCIEVANYVQGSSPMTSPMKPQLTRAYR